MKNPEVDVEEILGEMSWVSPAVRNQVALFKEFIEPENRIGASIPESNIPRTIGVFGSVMIGEEPIVLSLIEDLRLCETGSRYFVLQLRRGYINKSDPLKAVQDLRQKWKAEGHIHVDSERVFAELLAGDDYPKLRSVMNPDVGRVWLSSPINKVWMRMQSRALELEGMEERR